MNSDTPSIQIDTRGMEPPEPMVLILEAVKEATEGTQILAITDRRPMFLLEELSATGRKWTSLQQADGSWQLSISL